MRTKRTRNKELTAAYAKRTLNTLFTNITVSARAKERDIAIIVSYIVLIKQDIAAQKGFTTTNAQGTRRIIGFTTKLKLDHKRDSVM